MFLGCKNLTSINFGEEGKWNTSEGIYMASMFEGCSSLTNLSLNKFNTEKVNVMEKMFKGCIGLLVLEIKNLILKM